MKRIIITIGVVCAGLMLLSSKANAIGMKEGQWSMTTVIHMEGMDNQMVEAQKEMENMSPEDKAMMNNMMGGMGMKMGGPAGTGISTTMTQCMTNDNPVPEASSEENCQETHSIQGNTVNFETVCTNSRSAGQVTYKHDTMKGTITATQTENGHETTSTIDLSGKYVSPCDQNTANVTSRVSQAAAHGLSEKELAIKEKELDLKRQELEIKQKKIELQSAGNKKTNGKSTLENVGNAVNTTNNVKNTFNGLRSLLGR